MGEQDPIDEQCFCLYLTNNGKKDKTSHRPAMRYNSLALTRSFRWLYC